MPDRTPHVEGLSGREVRSMLDESGGVSASSDRVNRTHRVVRERAKTLADRRSKVRSLWLPLLLFSVGLIGICIAMWTVFEEYELAGTSTVSYRMLVPLVWSVPVSAALLAVVWFRRPRGDAGRGSAG